MFSGFYTIASGMMVRQRELDVVGENLVNVQTPGYKADRMTISSFQQALLTRQEALGQQTLGHGDTAAVVDRVQTLHHTGLIKQTGRVYDVAIQGQGYFCLQGADGQLRLTRNGQFALDEQGYLVLPGSGRVLGADGPIYLNTGDFEVRENGAVIRGDGSQAGVLRIEQPGDTAQLVKEENGVFRPTGAVQAAQGYALSQNSLELSNVDMSQELSQMIEAQRAFQSCSSALQIIDAMNRKLTSQFSQL